MQPLVLISSLANGGAERVTVDFLRRLAGTDYPARVCTVTSRHDGPLAEELAGSGVMRRDLGATRLADPRALVRLVWLLRSERPTLVHAHGQDASILAAAARCVSEVPLLVTRHVLDEPAGNWRQNLRARLALTAFRRADTVVAVSRAVAEHLARLARLAPHAIQVIPNGIDLSLYRAPDRARRAAEFRQKMNFAPEEFLVLLPAMLRPDKGHETLIAAMVRLRERMPSVRALFAGEGEREPELRALARPLGDAVVFAGVCRDMPAAFTAADLVVLPSLAEGLPTALMEAAAAGRAVVATRVGGTAEIVEHGRTGLLVPPEDPAALAEAILSLLADRERAAGFGAAARQRAGQRFGIDFQVERTLALWQKITARRAA